MTVVASIIALLATAIVERTAIIEAADAARARAKDTMKSAEEDEVLAAAAAAAAAESEIATAIDDD